MVFEEINKYRFAELLAGQFSADAAGAIYDHIDALDAEYDFDDHNIRECYVECDCAVKTRECVKDWLGIDLPFDLSGKGIIDELSKHSVWAVLLPNGHILINTYGLNLRY